ncbi:glycosyltransferase [Kitasatospora sp. NPDC048365]|uniref:glycosyltransferase n=1 Tax=Kitasatospora sp. NPDC048365 TaxID=3364050 RepID=UPI0037156114
MTYDENPYRQVGQPASGERYVERPELTARITAVWRSPGRPGNLSVSGHRRVGKTSLVDHALGLNDRDDLGIVRFDVGRFTSALDLFRAVTREVAGHFADSAELARLSAAVREAPEWYDLYEAVTDFFDELRRQDRWALIVLDEFDRAPRCLPELSTYQFLRALASEPRHPVGLVTVSRRPIVEIEIDAAGGSLLDGVMAQRCHVGLFQDGESAQLLERASAVGVDLAAVGPELLAYTGNHPYLLELLCDRVVQYYLESGTLDVASAYEQQAPLFQAYFERLVQAVDLDTSGAGPEALRGIAAGTAAPVPPTVLRQLTDKGIVLRDGDGGLALFSSEFARHVLGPDGGPVSAAAGSAYRCTALVLATEWNSAHGGLSTFNRRLCLALAAQRVQVFCLVLEAGAEDVAEAAAGGVTVLCAPAREGVPEFSRLLWPPQLPNGVAPDLVIGHGRVTGPIARMLAEDRFPGARKLHFVHTAPDEIEWHKSDRGDDAAESAEARTGIELALGRAADRLVAVGPRLHGRFLGYLSRHDDREPLRFDPGFDVDDRRPRRVPRGTPVTVLLMGRTDEAVLKGVDLAARAGGIVAGWRYAANLGSVELVVRGVPESRTAEQRDRIRAWAGNDRLGVVPRTFTTDAQRLGDDLLRASLLVMPSRAEGFGLVALEAIVAGTPVLVSENSGIGELLRGVLGTERAGNWVVPMSGDFDQDAETWARSIDRVLRSDEQEFARAQELREELARTLPWSRSTEVLLAAVGL